MADWRQIQARIRKAKVGEDAPAKLTQLFDRTRDGMVAFELASLLERLSRTEEAVQWYTTAAQRFRRADWKQKAADALTRLGAPVPEITAEPGEASPRTEQPGEASAPHFEADAEVISTEPQPQAEAQPESADAAQAASPTGAAAARKRRRGRRGGRGRNKGRGEKGQAARPAAPAPRAMPAPPPPAPREEPRQPLPPRPQPMLFEPEPEGEPEPSISRAAGHPGFRGGDPALASRMAQLESRLRRLIASPVYTLDQVEEAPAGPGVFLLSDSDQVTHYYAEACQTLRIALGNLVKSGRVGAREDSFSLRPGLAEHLGISETKVKDYLRKHCVIRWLQMDEGAAFLAHFAIAVLRPVLNVEQP